MCSIHTRGSLTDGLLLRKIIWLSFGEVCEAPGQSTKQKRRCGSHPEKVLRVEGSQHNYELHLPFKYVRSLLVLK
jgi:hypothetical protein